MSRAPFAGPVFPLAVRARAFTLAMPREGPRIVSAAWLAVVWLAVVWLAVAWAFSKFALLSRGARIVMGGRAFQLGRGGEA